jgi:hypothetical protein
MLRSEFEQLQAHAASNITEFTVNQDGTDINVMWDNTQSNVITADDVNEELGAYPLLTNVVLRFITL